MVPGTELTLINTIILHNPILDTLHGLLVRLSLEDITRITKALGALGHGALEGISLPAKDVVAVLGEAVSVFARVNKSKWAGMYEGNQETTYLSPVLQTKGCEPSTGQRSLSLKMVVCHTISISVSTLSPQTKKA